MILNLTGLSAVEGNIARDLAEWNTPLIKHPVQERLVAERRRFKVVPAGRRSGKTLKAKRNLAREAMRVPGLYFAAAPTREHAKKIFWEDLKRLCFCSVLPRKPSESELMIYLPNGSVIVLVGLDKPERIEGIAWMGGVVDEIADVKEDAWEKHISPALDTLHPHDPNYKAWCWLIGVPDGLNHYYELAEYARTSGDDEWGFYTWFSVDILGEERIAKARQRMSAKQFRQEYEASFETASGKIYEDYSDANHTTEQIAKHEQLLWAHDFNFTPMSSVICTRRANTLYALDEIVLESAVAKQAALEFVEKYKDHENRNLVLYGDPAGKAGEKHGHPSDYVEIEKVLKDYGWRVERRVKSAAPSIKERQNAVRAKICNAANERTLYINPKFAKYMHKGLATVQLKGGSTFQEKESKYQHITTALGYLIEREWPVRHDDGPDVDHFEPIPNESYY